jgi:hypothetical protein
MYLKRVHQPTSKISEDEAKESSEKTVRNIERKDKKKSKLAGRNLSLV